MTMTNQNWIALPAATVDDLEAELQRRREEAERAKLAAAEEKRERDKRRRELVTAAPGMVRGWRKRLEQLTKTDEGRPSPDLRDRARGALLRGEWAAVLDNDVTCAGLQTLAREAAALLVELEGVREVDERLLVDVDGVEVTAFGAVWLRIHELAGVLA
jgi:uncharacterized protein YhaN